MRRAGPDERSHDKRRAASRRSAGTGSGTPRRTTPLASSGRSAGWRSPTPRRATVTAGPALVRRRMVPSSRGRWRCSATGSPPTRPSAAGCRPGRTRRSASPTGGGCPPRGPAGRLGPAEVAVVAGWTAGPRSRSLGDWWPGADRAPGCATTTRLPAAGPAGRARPGLVGRGPADEPAADACWRADRARSGTRTRDGRPRRTSTGCSRRATRSRRRPATRTGCTRRCGPEHRVHRADRRDPPPTGPVRCTPGGRLLRGHRPGPRRDAGVGRCWPVAAPLEVLLRAARWLTVAIAEAYGAGVPGALEELAAEAGDPEVAFADLWYLAQGPLSAPATGRSTRSPPSSRRAWAGCSGWTTSRRGRPAAGAVRRRPGRPGGRHLSRPTGPAGRRPDPQPGPADLRRRVEEIDRGAAWSCWASCTPPGPRWTTAVFIAGHEDPDGCASSSPPTSARPGAAALPAVDAPRHRPGDLGPEHPTESGSPSRRRPAPTGRCVPITAPAGRRRYGELVVDGPGTGRWPLLEVFSELLPIARGRRVQAGHRPAAHSPHHDRPAGRRTGDLADHRRRVGPGRRDREPGPLPGRPALAPVAGPAGAGLRQALHRDEALLTSTCPARCSPTSLCAMVRTARQQGGGAVAVVVSEALPGPEQAWVPDRQGRRYQSELRLQVVDPACPGPWRRPR